MAAIEAATSGAADALFGGASPFGWAKLGVDLLKGAAGSPAGPSMAMGSVGGSSQSFTFDNSGWTVATSGSTASATAGARYGSQAGPGGGAYPSMEYGQGYGSGYGSGYQTQQAQQINPTMLLAVFGLVGVALIMRKG